MRLIVGSLLVIVASFTAGHAAARASPFGVDRVQDAALSEVRGGYASPGFSRNARVAIDQSARSVFDATASINRTTFDNWFAREGADLLSASALGRPLLLF